MNKINPFKKGSCALLSLIFSLTVATGAYATTQSYLHSTVTSSLLPNPTTTRAHTNNKNASPIAGGSVKQLLTDIAQTLQTQQQNLQNIQSQLQKNAKKSTHDAQQSAHLSQVLWNHYLKLQATLNYPAQPMPGWGSTLALTPSLSVFETPSDDAFSGFVCSNFPSLEQQCQSGHVFFNASSLFEPNAYNHYGNQLAVAVGQSIKREYGGDRLSKFLAPSASVALSNIALANTAFDRVSSQSHAVPKIQKAANYWLSSSWQSHLATSTSTQSLRAISTQLAFTNSMMVRMYKQNQQTDALLAGILTELVQQQTELANIAKHKR